MIVHSIYAGKCGWGAGVGPGLDRHRIPLFLWTKKEGRNAFILKITLKKKYYILWRRFMLYQI